MTCANCESLQRDLDAARRLAEDRCTEINEAYARIEASQRHVGAWRSVAESRELEIHALHAQLASAEEALVHVAHGMHKQPQYMLMRGLRLIDGNRAVFTLPNGSVVDAALSADKPQEGAQ